MGTLREKFTAVKLSGITANGDSGRKVHRVGTLEEEFTKPVNLKRAPKSSKFVPLKACPGSHPGLASPL